MDTLILRISPIVSEILHHCYKQHVATATRHCICHHRCRWCGHVMSWPGDDTPAPSVHQWQRFNLGFK